jgi:DNA-binding transcriptional LysR family regulator
MVRDDRPCAEPRPAAELCRHLRGGAARALGLRQSTISQHLQKLEAATGRRLIDRNTHRVRISPEGEAVLEHARRVLEAHDQMARALNGAPLRGRLRFGASEDFVLSALPDVLAAFVRRHPDVDMELTAGLSEDLYGAFDAGALDIIFVKRRAGDARGVTAWREPIAWIGRPDYWLDADTPLPLLLYPAPSVTRARAFETLDAARRVWRIAFTSGSLSALSAAARAGIGLMPHSVRLMPPGLAVVPPEPDLPRLPDVEFVIIGPGRGNAVAEALTGVILQWAAYGGVGRG